MSLQVWLPLNKKIVNAGLGNVNVINNGVTISDNGILGKCGSFTTSQYIELTNVPFTKLNNCSVSFWIKLDANEGEWLLLSGQGEAYYLLAWRSESYNNGNFYHMGVGTVHKIYVDGIEGTKPIRDGNWHHYCAVGVNFSTWTKLYVNRYVSTGNAYNFTGLLNDFRIYDYALSAADVLRIYQNKNIYEIPISLDMPAPSLPLWIKVLHHNVPSSNLFTTANCMKNTTDNLYSRLGIYFNSTIFKRWNDKYEFLANEKLESGSTEQNYQWRQLSNPTASTITGFESIKNTSNSSYLVGLKHNGNYSVFHNGGTWWCACGCYSAYQGGIPGFGNVIKSGYLDLYAKARIGRLPNDYEELEWAKFAPGQYINTELYVVSGETCTTNARLRYESGGSGRDLMGWCPSSAEYWGVTTASTWERGSYTNSDITKLNDFKYTFKSAKYNGTYQICALVGSYSVRAKYIYDFKIYVNDDLKRHMIPCMRKSDSKVGMFDIVTKKFYTHTGSGDLVAGPIKQYMPKEYEKLEYIKSTGTQWINTQFVPGAGTKLKIKFKQESAQTNSTYYPISCVRANDNKLLLECFIRQTNLYALSVAGNEFTGNYDPVTSMLDIELSLTKVVINGNVVRTGSTVSVTNSRPLFLLAYNKDGNPDTTRYMSCNLYEAKIYETENGLDLLKMNLVPSKRKSDNVIGMYDIVSGQFFTNSGTGSFTGA